MTADEVVRRLRAYEKGRALPRGETLRVRRLPASSILVLAFVRMGGESAPWGIAFGRPDKAAEVLTVPEPRNRDDVAAMVAKLAPTLLAHLHHPQHSPYGPDPDVAVPPFQVWLPNDAHVDMLHHLSYAYTFARFGDPSRVARLQAVGRACGWLFREAHRPGQTVVMSAARQLTESYTFPAETTRQGHTGFLLAGWKVAGATLVPPPRQRPSNCLSRSASTRPSSATNWRIMSSCSTKRGSPTIRPRRTAPPGAFTNCFPRS